MLYTVVNIMLFTRPHDTNSILCRGMTHVFFPPGAISFLLGDITAQLTLLTGIISYFPDGKLGGIGLKSPRPLAPSHCAPTKEKVKQLTRPRTASVV
jgi:hypothetical protein